MVIGSNVAAKTTHPNSGNGMEIMFPKLLNRWIRPHGGPWYVGMGPNKRA
jgi:hypothetical protein